MSKATKITFQREVTDKIKDIPLIDGQLIYNIETGATYQDVPATTNNTTIEQQQEKQEIVRIKTSSGNINPILYPLEDKDRAYLYLEIDKNNNKTISWKTIDEISHNGFLPQPITTTADNGRCLICMKKNEDSSIETAWKSFIPTPNIEGAPGYSLILDENNNPVWRDLGNNKDKEGYMKNPPAPKQVEEGPWNLQMTKENIKDEAGKEIIGIKYTTKWDIDKNIKYPETKENIPENSVLSINKDQKLFWQSCITNPKDAPKEDSLLLVDKNNNPNWRPANFYLPLPAELPDDDQILILQYKKEIIEIDNPNYSEDKPDEPVKINQTIWKTYWEKTNKYISSPEKIGTSKQVLTINEETQSPSWETPPYVNAPLEEGMKNQFLVSDGNGGTFWRSFSELFVNGEEIGY